MRTKLGAFKIIFERGCALNKLRSEIISTRVCTKLGYLRYVVLLNSRITWLEHSHKKRKDSLETRGELAVLRSYIKDQAILEPILLYRASKCKQTEKQGSEDCL